MSPIVFGLALILGSLGGVLLVRRRRKQNGFRVPTPDDYLRSYIRARFWLTALILIALVLFPGLWRESWLLATFIAGGLFLGAVAGLVVNERLLRALRQAWGKKRPITLLFSVLGYGVVKPGLFNRGEAATLVGLFAAHDEAATQANKASGPATVLTVLKSGSSYYLIRRDEERKSGMIEGK